MDDAQFTFLSTQRDEFVQCEQNGRSDEVVGEVRILDHSYGSVQKDENIEWVEELVGGPECCEDMSASRRRGEGVHDAYDNDQQNTGETCNATTAAHHITLQ